MLSISASRAMLTVYLPRLWPKDRFTNTFRWETKMVPRKVENHPGRGPKWLLEASGGLLGDRRAGKAARKPNLGGSWVRLGRSWRLLGRSPGALLGPPGALLGAPGALLGSLWGASWTLQDPPKSLPEALPEAPRTGA